MFLDSPWGTLIKVLCKRRFRIPSFSCEITSCNVLMTATPHPLQSVLTPLPWSRSLRWIMEGSGLSERVQKALGADNQSALLVMSEASHLSVGGAITAQNLYTSRSGWYWLKLRCVHVYKDDLKDGVLEIPQAGGLFQSLTMKGAAGGERSWWGWNGSRWLVQVITSLSCDWF